MAALPAPTSSLVELKSASAGPPMGIDDLRGLMESVAETALRLQETHAALHARVEHLQRELAEANAALRRSQALAALGEMAAGIAHEIRNPLGSIQLYVQMLAEDLSDRPAQAEVCGKIDRAVNGLDAIVRDVLNFARDVAIRPEPVSAANLFDRGLEACESLLREAVEIERNDDAAIRLVADPILVGQALANVIRNAAEAMLESGSSVRKIRLEAGRRRVRRSDGRNELHGILAVQDTGPGIPESVRDRIFNPFFTTRHTGTGLGLAIVHRIVDAHGGHIHLESETSGGTRVELRLPLRPQAAGAAAETRSEQCT